MPMSQAPSPHSSSRSRRRTSPVRCTWGTHRRSPSRTPCVASGGCAASRSNGAPGTDHAAIATQNVIERQLAEEGTTKEAAGQGRVPDASRRLVRGIRRTHLRADATDGIHVRLGALCVSRSTTSTCAPSGSCSRRCSTRGSSIAAHESSTGVPAAARPSATRRSTGRSRPTRSTTSSIRSRVAWSITVATVRPETMLGDTGVAVAPGDSRYTSLIGKHVDAAAHMARRADLRRRRGAARVRHRCAQGHARSRSHRLRDRGASFAADHQRHRARRHHGRAVAAAVPWHARRQARTAVAEALRATGRARQGGAVHARRGSLRPLRHRARATGERAVVGAHGIARGARASAPSKVARSPSTPRGTPTCICTGCATSSDWCISRQIWLGHAIPVSTCANGHRFAWIDPPTRCPECGDTSLTNDPDVLDTWFSSGLWPFAIFGWPEQTAELEKFYPTDVLVTGRDIIFLWVARMIMTGSSSPAATRSATC